MDTGAHTCPYVPIRAHSLVKLRIDGVRQFASMTWGVLVCFNTDEHTGAK
jgi:hypothetical protein